MELLPDEVQFKPPVLGVSQDDNDSIGDIPEVLLSMTWFWDDEDIDDDNATFALAKKFKAALTHVFLEIGGSFFFSVEG